MSKIFKIIFDYNKQKLDEMTRDMKEADKAADDLGKSVNDAGKKSDEGFSNMSSGINKLVTGAKAFIALEVVQRMAAIASESMKAAAEVEGVASSFRNLGYSRKDLLALRETVGGTVEDFKLMQLAVKAAQQQLGKNELQQVLAFADKAADGLGESFEGVADVLMNSIGKQSTMGLQRFGFSISDVEKRAKEIGFVPALMEEMAKKSKELGEVSAEAGDSTDKLATAQKNLMVAIGELMNSGAMNDLRNWMAELIQSGADKISDPFGLAKKSMIELELEVSRLEKALSDSPNIFQILNPFRETLDPAARIEAINMLKAVKKEIEDRIKAEEDAATKAAGDAKKKREDDARKKQEEANKQRIKELIEWGKEENDMWDKVLAKRAELIKKREEDLSNFLGDIREQRLLELLLGEQEAINELVKIGQDMELKELIANLPDPTKIPKEETDKDVEEAVENIVVFTDDMAENLQQSALYALSIYDSFAALNKLGDDPKSILRLILSLSGLGLQTFGGAKGKLLGTLFSGIGARLNTGGWVEGGVNANFDSVPALLTNKEFVVNRNSAARSKFLLEQINEGKINDKLLLNLGSPNIVNLNQEKVVEAIKGIPQVDFYASAATIIEAKRYAHNQRVSIKRRVAI